MSVRLAACVALARVAGAAAAPPAATPAGQAAATAPAVDAAELKAVQQLRARIAEKQKAAPPAKPYTVTIPNTTATYGMAPIPAGTFEIGVRRAEQPGQHQHRAVEADEHRDDRPDVEGARVTLRAGLGRVCHLVLLTRT